MSDTDRDEITDLSNPNVTTKYQTAATIANKALEAVIKAATPGALISDVCAVGDKCIEEECSKVYTAKVKGKKLDKGISFPTCVSPNNIAGHYSPLKHDSKTLSKGDLVKIDLGAHIDGYIAMTAHTIVLGEDKITDKRADVIQCAWAAAEAVLRLARAGNKSSSITEMIKKIAAQYSCQPMMGVYSHMLSKDNLESGHNVIPGKIVPEQNNEEFEFGVNEAYAIDIAMSTAEGKGRESDFRTTVFRRDPDANYVLKTSKARQFVSEVHKRYQMMAFSVASFEDEQTARVGSLEAKRHDLLQEYPVMKERDGEFIAQFKFTLLLLPGGTKKITGLALDHTVVESSKSIEDAEIKALLASSANPKKQKKKANAAEKKAKEQVEASKKK